MEFGYEERSRRLMERLDRIQNYLQSLPPLPKIGSVSGPRGPAKETGLIDVGVQNEGSLTNDESEDSVESSTTRQSVSTKASRAIPKNDFAGELLQKSITPSPDNSKAFDSGSVSAVDSGADLGKTKKKKKRRRETRVQDPLKPTSRISFGVDIGQAINVINYIKQNAIPGSSSRNKRLAGIITKDVDPALHTEKSMDRIYKQGPLSAASSTMSGQLKNRGGETTRKAGGGPKHMSFGVESAASPKLSTDADMYRLRYQERAVELPHYHGLDALQELFVPYMDHDPYTKTEPNRSMTNDYE